MTEADRPHFVETLVAFAEIKGRKLSLPQVELYWRSMREWPIEAFDMAAEHLLKTSQYFPDPYAFEQLRKSTRATAGEAWKLALEHASSSRYRYGDLGVELIDDCVHMLGGYVAIAMCDVDRVHFLERRFSEHFETKQDAVETRAALPQLATRPILHLPKSAT